MGLAAFYNDVTYLTPVMKHITYNKHNVFMGREEGLQYFDTLYLRFKLTIDADLYFREQ
jgi:hypothetical protein